MFLLALAASSEVVCAPRELGWIDAAPLPCLLIQVSVSPLLLNPPLDSTQPTFVHLFYPSFAAMSFAYHLLFVTMTFNNFISFFLFLSRQQFGPILDVEIIFNERGSKVRQLCLPRLLKLILLLLFLLASSLANQIEFFCCCFLFFNLIFTKKETTKLIIRLFLFFFLIFFLYISFPNFRARAPYANYFPNNSIKALLLPLD